MADNVESFQKAQAQETIIKAVADYTTIVFNYHRLPTPENHAHMMRAKFLIDTMLHDFQDVAKAICEVERAQK